MLLEITAKSRARSNSILMRIGETSHPKCSPVSATTTSPSTLGSSFKRWKSVVNVDNKRALRDILHAWRRETLKSSDERRDLIATVLALRTEVLAHVMRAWYRVTRERKARDAAVHEALRRAATRRKRDAVRAWHRYTRETNRRRVKTEAMEREKEALEMKLRLASAEAERDAALERARGTEKLYRAVDFNSNKIRERWERERNAEREARAIALRETAGAVLDGCDRRALQSMLWKLREHYVQELRSL